MARTYRIKPRPGFWALVPGDMHFDQEDSEAIGLMMDHWDVRRGKVTEVKRDTVVIPQGDTLDCYGVSKFTKASQKVWLHGQVAKEVAKARPFLHWAVAGGTHAVLIPGNHENRLKRITDDNPGLEGLPGVTFGVLTGLNDIEGLDILDHGSRVLLGDKCVVAHGDKLTGWKTARAIANNYPDQVTVYGHTHQISSFLRTVYDAEGNPAVRGAYNVGHLSAIPEYVSDPSWQLGFAEIEFHGDRGGGRPFFSVHQHMIFRNALGEARLA